MSFQAVLWRYKFSQLKGSSDDGKSKIKFLFQNPESKSIEAKVSLAFVMLHKFIQPRTGVPSKVDGNHEKKHNVETIKYQKRLARNSLETNGSSIWTVP